MALSKYRTEFAIVVPALTRALDDEEWMVRGAAAESLGAYGPRAKEALPRLKSLLGEKMKHDRRGMDGKTQTESVHEKASRAIYLIERN